MEESSSCYSCGHETSEVVAECPQCGRRLRTAKQVHGLGWLQLAIGIYLVGLVWMITYKFAPLMLALVGDARFPGEQYFLGLFGVVVALGLCSMLSGLWRMKIGRNNRWLSVAMVALCVMFMLLILFFRAALRVLS